MGETTRALYLGTQRIILVLLHDFPDFLSQAFFALCDVIPPQCVQLHNLLGSAFPVVVSQRLPDPLQPGLKMESLPEVSKSPQILADYTQALSAADLRAPLDKFIATRSPTTFPSSLKERLLATSRNDASDPKYNVPLVNSLVLYLGILALNQSKATSGTGSYNAKATPTLLLQQLINEIEPEGATFPLFVVDSKLTFSSRSILCHCGGRDASPTSELAYTLLQLSPPLDLLRKRR